MPEKERRPLIAGLLSVLNVGLGFVYNGSLTKGIIATLCYFLLDVCLGISGANRSFPFALFAASLSTAVWVYFIFHNASQARRIGTIQLKSYNCWYIYVLYLSVSLSPSFLIDTTSGTGSYAMPVGSMSPALEDGEHVAFDQHYYLHHEIGLGDVVVFQYPKEHRVLMLKRCIALGGATVAIRDGLVYVNSERSLPTLLLKRQVPAMESPDFKDPQIVPPGAGNQDQYSSLVVPKGKLLVLGDLRDNSFDSRFFGFVDRNEVVGKVLYIWWSSDFSQIGKAVQ